SPDGKWIAFIADRGKKNQIYLIRPNGGEAQPITSEEEGINRYRWSPDGKQIVFSLSEKQPDTEKDREKRYGKFAEDDTEYRQSHLWLIDVEPDPWPARNEIPEYLKASASDTNDTDTTCIEIPKKRFPKPVRLTEGPEYTVVQFEWSPDGTSIAFVHRKNPLWSSIATSDISVITIENKKIRSLVSSPWPEANPVWSPDSKWILYQSTDEDSTSFFYKTNKMFMISTKGGERVQLIPDFDENVYNIRWMKTGIYFIAWQKTNRYIYKINQKSNLAKLLFHQPDVILSMDFSKDGRILTFTGFNSELLEEIYLTRLPKNKINMITNMSKQIKDWRLGTSEVVTWESKDGTMIEGVMHKPYNFDPNNKYPLLVIIHGGPTGIDFPIPVEGYVYPMSQWLNKGAVILRPNYRGSAGYGESFRSLNVRNLGVGDAWDVLSGVDFLIKEGFVDSSRMGAMGWSQGGYISAFLTTNTDRFKAISVGAGISNWVTYYVNTDIHPFTRQYLKANPWEDPEIYAKTSPMTSILKAKTPTLIQHGENDKRVPIPNAYELYQGLKDVGVETKLIVYKNFGHGISKPKERLAALWHNWQWFAKYIWGEEVEPPLSNKKEDAAVNDEK
ncbi:peptidase S9 family protein, partial [bacterium I07]